MDNPAMPAAEGNYIEVEPGVDIYCEERGRGPAVVIVPGWTFTTEVFKYQLEGLSANHRVVVFDPRSQGRSTVTTSGNDYATHASDLAGVMDALKLRDVVLVGWSFGALTTWGYIRANGVDNVKCHVCVDMSPLPLSVNADDWTEGPLDEIAGVFSIIRTSSGQREFVAGYAREIMVQRKLKPGEMKWIVDQSASKWI